MQRNFLISRSTGNSMAAPENRRSSRYDRAPRLGRASTAISALLNAKGKVPGGTRTTVIEGSLAFQMRRAIAARTNECGLQILSLPQLAARLAGGFTTPVAKGNLDLAIQHALAAGMFSELEAVRNLPGMTRAVSRTLRKIWDADVDLRAVGTAGNIRVRELALIEERVRMHLPKAMLIPEIPDTALSRIHHAARVLGRSPSTGSRTYHRSGVP